MAPPDEWPAVLLWPSLRVSAGPTLSDAQRRALPHFVYRGSDRSLLYRFALSPLADFFVANFTPRWLA